MISRIPPAIVEEVRARTDIAEVIGRVVSLKKAGRSYVGLCPFHADRKPSFHVVPDKGLYHCFPCGEGGDVYRFLQKTRGLSFVEAVKELAGPLGIAIDERELTPEERKRAQVRADLHGAAEEAARLFEATLLTSAEGLPGREYLEKRGVDLETARKYRLGFAPNAWDRLATHLARVRIPTELGVQAGLLKRRDRGGSGVYDTFRNRLIFPILDDRGRPVAFGGRLLPGADEGPKYLNSPESPIYDKSRTLYGLSWARTAIQRHDRAILVEGYFDAVSLWRAGVEEAVATCGTSLTPHHAETIRRLAPTAIACFDADEAGLRAATRALGLFLPAGVEARRVDLADAKDPDEYVTRHGADAFRERLEHAEPLVELVVRRSVEREGSTAEGRARALASLAPTLGQLPDLLREQMIDRVSGLLGIRDEQVRARLSAPRPAPVQPDAAAAARWRPTTELTHLLWLLIHHPARMAPRLAELDPSLVSDRREVLEAIARLACGARLPEVLEACADPDVCRVLRAVAARADLYQEEAVSSAIDSLLARIELAQVEARIGTISAQLRACETTGDKSSYATLAREISALHARRQALRARVARPMSANVSTKDSAR